jgi:hypothetical protein
MHSIKQASILLGISERAVKHYRAIYTSDVVKETDGSVLLTDRFIEKVKNARKVNADTISDTRTKLELVNEIEDLKKKLAEKEKQESLELGLHRQLDGTFNQVMTKEELEEFTRMLQDYWIKIKELKLKDIHFSKELGSKDEIIKSYRNDVEYFRKSYDKIVAVHNKLIDSIQGLTTNTLERNRIEAVEKGVIPKQPREI